MSVDFVRTQITQMYINFEADDTWKQELAEVSQIIALTTQVQQLSTKLETTITLATTDNQSGKAISDRRRTTNNKKYTVSPWSLVKKGDTIKCNKGHTWHWCTEEHYSDGATHKECTQHILRVLPSCGRSPRAIQHVYPADVLRTFLCAQLHCCNALLCTSAKYAPY